MVVREQTSGDHQCHCGASVGNHKCLYKLLSHSHRWNRWNQNQNNFKKGLFVEYKSLRKPSKSGQKNSQRSQGRGYPDLESSLMFIYTNYKVCLVYSSQWSVSGRDKSLRLYLSQCHMFSPWVSSLTVDADFLKLRREKTHSFSITVYFPGLTVSDVTVNSSGLLHTIKLQHFHQVAFIFSGAFWTQYLCSYCVTTF